MSSPFLPYAKSYVLLGQEGAPTVVDGRFVSTEEQKYLVHCYLGRVDVATDYPNATSKLPDFSGASGVSYVYRGFALRYAPVPALYVLGETGLDGLNWTTLSAANRPEWLSPGATGRHLQGNEKTKQCRIVRATGRYGGLGIDELMSNSINGLPVTILSGDILN
jgi:hypothetical protein